MRECCQRAYDDGHATYKLIVGDRRGPSANTIFSNVCAIIYDLNGYKVAQFCGPRQIHWSPLPNTVYDENFWCHKTQKGVPGREKLSVDSIFWSTYGCCTKLICWERGARYGAQFRHITKAVVSCQQRNDVSYFRRHEEFHFSAAIQFDLTIIISVDVSLLRGTILLQILLCTGSDVNITKYSWIALPGDAH